MMKSSREGNLAIFIEMLLIVILIVAFLFVAVARDKLKKNQAIVREVYPGSVLKTAPVSPEINEGVSVPFNNPNLKNAPVYSFPGGQKTSPYVEVVYTDKGFYPEVTALSSGHLTVYFRNSSNHLMWVASDPHPTHSNFPLFDEQVGIKPGAGYWFAFPDSPKKYTFHNHLMPNHRGAIIVQ